MKAWAYSEGLADVANRLDRGLLDLHLFVVRVLREIFYDLGPLAARDLDPGDDGHYIRDTSSNYLILHHEQIRELILHLLLKGLIQLEPGLLISVLSIKGKNSRKDELPED